MKKALVVLSVIVLATGCFGVWLFARNRAQPVAPIATVAPATPGPGATAAPSAVPEGAASALRSVRGAAVDWIFDGETPILEPEGSTFILKSAHFAQEEAPTENAPTNLGYTGTLQVTVHSTKVYNTPGEAAIAWEDIPFPQEKVAETLDSPVFLLVDLTLENVDAAMAGAVPHEFSSDLFTLRDTNDFLPENLRNTMHIPDSVAESMDGYYFSGHPVGSDKTATNYRSFTLNQGEAIDMQLGYFVNSAYLSSHQPVLKLGFASENSHGILLNPVA
ncbi:MAG: hypothetical protein PHG73_04705 [Pygmaiobacter sp.]|nr:hypothetical protein [Pygmaiobacter sp.]